MRWRIRARWAALAAGLVLILTGVGIVVSGAYANWLAQESAAARQYNDQNALSAWNDGGSQALEGAASSASASAPQPTTSAAPATANDCGGGSDPNAFALVEFTGLPQYDYAGVAMNGNWTLLDDSSMVHWYGSPAPGGAGNVIIAFHREPDFQYVDQLTSGDTVTIQDRSCNTYIYTVSQGWDLAPSAVTQLVPTSGHELTLITCTPWWVDTHRLVWRAQLTSVNGTPVADS
jgi:LPXTG-site transpeptidase (sortase) family protein